MARNASNLTEGLNFSNITRDEVKKQTEKKAPAKKNTNTEDKKPVNNEASMVAEPEVKEEVPVVEVSPVVQAPVQPVYTTPAPQQKRKIGITLTEENYLHLKKESGAVGMKMQDYLNALIDNDRINNKHHYID